MKEGPPPAKQAPPSHLRAVSLNQSINMGLNSSQLAPPERPVRSRMHNQTVIINNHSVGVNQGGSGLVSGATSTNNDALSDIQSSQSMVVDDKSKQRAKRRTFSINSSILMPSHGRKTSKIPSTLLNTSQLRSTHTSHRRTNVVNGSENYMSQRPILGSDI